MGDEQTTRHSTRIRDDRNDQQLLQEARHPNDEAEDAYREARRLNPDIGEEP
jgi:hypothetical protein